MKRIVQNLKNLKEIVDGWANYIWPDEKVEAIAKERAEICADCPLNTNGYCDSNKSGEAVEDGVYHGEQRKKGNTYHGCSCPISVKTKSPQSVCPLLKWKEMNYESNS